MLKPLLLLALAGLAAGDPCSPSAADPACIECDSTGTKCTECNYASFLTETGICVECSMVLPHCLECSDADTCTACASWYGPKIEGDRVTCTRCADKACEDCRDDWQECVQCDYLFNVVVNGSCHKCNSTCRSCTADGACLDCGTGYGLFNGHCLPCKADLNCAQCNGDLARCTDCYPFFGPSVDGRCTKCSQKSCSTCDKSPDECEACNPDAYMAVNRTCVPLPENCYAAESDGKCYQCQGGHGVSGGLCKPCSAGPNCAQCDGSAQDQCTACKEGPFALVDGRCVPCADSHCTRCLPGPKVCEFCTDGFYITPNGTCLKKTIEGCDQPDNDGSCKTCEPMMGLVGGKCVKCQVDRRCSRCDGDPAVCTECFSIWHTLQNGTCKYSISDMESTIPGCSPGMIRNGECTECFTGFYPSESPSYTMVDGVCRPCADPFCLSCKTQRNCTNCRTRLNFDEKSGRCVVPSGIQRPADAPHGR